MNFGAVALREPGLDSHLVALSRSHPVLSPTSSHLLSLFCTDKGKNAKKNLKSVPIVILGQFCNNDVDECRLQPNACQNGGTCSNTLNGYNCVCVNGWSGFDCSVNINDCAPAPCTAGSTCIDRVASFVCSCPPGKTGE